MTTLTLPSPALVMLVGAAGSGKSTFAEKNFRKSEIVSSDFCREAVCDDATNQRISDTAFDLFHFWIEQRLKLGRLTVADSTALRPSARAKLRDIASRNNVPVVVIRVEADEATAQRQNLMRQRRVPEDIVTRHVAHATEAAAVLDQEGYAKVITVTPGERYEIRFEGEADKHVLTGPGFDVIGDVHGCAHELILLLGKLGYQIANDGGYWKVSHPEGRKIVFVGDLTDRGPDSLPVLVFVKTLVDQGIAESVMGNHDSKLWRALKGNNVKRGHGLQGTMQQIEERLPPSKLPDYVDFLSKRPYQVRLVVPGAPEVIVCHAGIPRNMVGRNDKSAQSHCIYGEVSGFQEDGMPNRSDKYIETWPAGDTDPILVHGHTVVREPWPSKFVNVVNVDQGCVFGGKLTAFRVPQMEIEQVEAAFIYSER